jgi:cytochrome oxidase assembly protein ShyY1
VILTVTPGYRRTLGRWQIARKLEIEQDLASIRREITDLSVRVAYMNAAKAVEAAEFIALTSRRGTCLECGESRILAIGTDGRRRCRTCREYRGMR